MVKAASKTAALNAGTGGRVSLRVGVDEQDPVPPTSDDGGKIDCGSSLADSAFLVRYGYCSSHLSDRGNLPEMRVSRVPRTLPQTAGTRETSPFCLGAFLLGRKEDEQGGQGARSQAGQASSLAERLGTSAIESLHDFI